MVRDQVLVFRTSITTMDDIERIEVLFAQYPCIRKWSVDFEDWEKVLRIENQSITADDVIKVLQKVEIVASEMK